MLICGRCNPPPENDPNYRGVYFASSDDLPAHAASMMGTPLRVEHTTQPVGAVLSAWTGVDGSMYALAEIDVRQPGGAVAAACVSAGRFSEFSLGYTSRMSRDPAGRLRVDCKKIRELSLVRVGARPNCKIICREG
jgi:hypothetical protein